MTGRVPFVETVPFVVMFVAGMAVWADTEAKRAARRARETNFILKKLREN